MRALRPARILAILATILGSVAAQQPGAPARTPARAGAPAAAARPALPPRALDLATLRAGFAQPPRAARPWAIWFWFRNDVRRVELSRELEEMAAAGLGGAEIRVIDDVLASDPARVPAERLPYLGKAWLDILAHVLAEARRLGLVIAIHPGMAWRYGGPWIPAEEQSVALEVRSEVVSGPVELRGRRPLLEGVAPDLAVGVHAWQLDETREGAFVLPSTHRDLGPGLTKGIHRYQLEAELPAGRWLVGAFIERRTGSPDHVTPGGSGYGRSFDPFSKTAVELQLREVGERIHARAGRRFGRTLTELATDSWEYGEAGVNWSPKVREAFPERAGYDLEPRLYALLDHGPGAVHVQQDIARVKSDLLVESFFDTIGRWCEAKGLRHRAQAYGDPEKDLFAAYRRVHVPEVEGPDPGPLAAPWVAHACGRPVVSAEAFTFLADATPKRLTEAASRYFAIGVNRLNLHSFSYSPPAAGVPGWRMYVPIHINRNSGWWKEAPALFAWMARTQWLLQAGSPVADTVAVGTDPGAAATFAWDRVDEPALACLLEPGEAGYHFTRAVVDPEALSLEGSGIVLDLLERGTRVVAAAAPSTWPALRAAGAEGEDLACELERHRDPGSLAVAPDPWERPPAAAALLRGGRGRVRLQQRRVRDGDVYYVANIGRDKVSATLLLAGAAGDIVEEWDPATGTQARMSVKTREGGALEVKLELEGESGRLLVVSLAPPE